jgi:hypothetical protein
MFTHFLEPLALNLLAAILIMGAGYAVAKFKKLIPKRKTVPGIIAYYEQLHAESLKQGGNP